jgi:hypothetical protein
VTRDQAVVLFERRRDAWLAGDLDAYLDLFAPDLVFQSPAHATPLVVVDGRAPEPRVVRARARPRQRSARNDWRAKSSGASGKMPK